MHQDAIWNGVRTPQLKFKRLCVRLGPTPSAKRGRSPHFRPSSIAVKRLDASRCHLVWIEGGRPQPRRYVLDGDPSPSQKRGRSPQFSADAYCDQTAVWIKMPLGTAVGLGPDYIVLDGDPAPRPSVRRGPSSPFPKRGRSPLPNFRPMTIVAKRLDDQDGTWHRGAPWSRPHCVTWGPSSHPQKEAEPHQSSAHLYCG